MSGNELEKKSNEFYYKNIWGNSCLVKAYIDKLGNFTSKPSAFYIGTYDSSINVDQFYLEVLRRRKEHKDEYQVGVSIPSNLSKYSQVMRNTVEDWEE